MSKRILKRKEGFYFFTYRGGLLVLSKRSCRTVPHPPPTSKSILSKISLRFPAKSGHYILS